MVAGFMYWVSLPIGSMYGIFTYIRLKFMVNVGKYTIHGSYGLRSRYVLRVWDYPLHSYSKVIPLIFPKVNPNLPKRNPQDFPQEHPL